MMHAYGKCARCGEEGALWRKTVRRLWLAWLFGLKAQKTIYVCDECDSLFAEAGVEDGTTETHKSAEGGP